MEYYDMIQWRNKVDPVVERKKKGKEESPWEEKKYHRFKSLKLIF